LHPDVGGEGKFHGARFIWQAFHGQNTALVSKFLQELG
jgi:hypothetical protein